jgi:hypothetical protein
MSDISPLNPERIIKVLAEFEVKYVLIGALAARLQGFPRMTADADITPARDNANLQRLATALKKLNAKVFTESIPEGLPFDCSAAMLKKNERWNLVTSAGRLDIAFKPAGTDGYDDLTVNAVLFEVFNTELLVSSLEDIVRSKKQPTGHKTDKM